MSKKKMITSILFFIVIISITFYSVFSKTSLSSMIDNLEQIKMQFGLICILLVIVYFLFQGLYTKIIFKSLNTNISLLKGMYYSIVEFFFSGITPSSTGGQPVQLYYMTKDKIPMRKSLIVLILDTIYFKLFLIIAAFIILIFRWDFIFANGKTFTFLFFLGVVMDLLLIIACYFLIFKQKVVKKVLTVLYKIGNKLRLKTDSDKVEETLENYRKETLYIKGHKKEVIIGMLITFIQRIFMFSIAFVIYKAFGFNSYNFIDLLVIQISVQLAIEGLPLPGGTGASEHLYKILYIDIFGITLASTGMFLTRLFSFYLPLIVICIIILIVTRVCYYNEKS